jgi:predicted amidophosphoribosyltransferase
MTTATTGAGLASARRAAGRIGMDPAEYVRGRRAGLRHCPRCGRWLYPDAYGPGTRCRVCCREIKRHDYHAHDGRGKGWRAATGEGDHLVCLDDRRSLQDTLVARVRTRAEAEEMVRAMNRTALAGMPGVEASRVPLYYCVREGEGEE